MTPIQAQVLLHCFYACDDYPGGNTPAVKDAYNWLELHGLIGLELDEKAGKSYVRTTERGATLVQAMIGTPMPVQAWVIPSPPEKE